MYRLFGSIASMFACLLLIGAAPDLSHANDDRRIADMLAAMLRAGRAVISSEQDRINDSRLGPKGLDGTSVLKRTIVIFQHTTGINPDTLKPGSREARLLGYEMDAIKAVMNSNEGSLDSLGVGFKGFIPAVFSRLVSEAFSQLAKGDARMRVTAPLVLVRNRKSRPDAWESATIQEHFKASSWPFGQSFEELTDVDGKPAFRIAVPEYYSASCLSCHGSPKGDLDITGYPKEGAALNDLGGVISITLAH